MSNSDKKLYFDNIDITQLDQKAKNFVSNISLGSVIFLNGDLGAGKTTFTKLIAKHLGVKETVISPTFVIAKEYQLPYQKFKNDAKLVHIDLYRLLETISDPRSLLMELEFNAINTDLSSQITIIEWGESIKDYLISDKKVEINIEHTDNEETRNISIVFE